MSSLGTPLKVEDYARYATREVPSASERKLEIARKALKRVQLLCTDSQRVHEIAAEALRKMGAV